MTGGGGRIIIKADSIDFSSAGPKLQADGMPLPGHQNDDLRKLQGGSGGYIYLLTENKKQKNNFHAKARISAVGGHGVGHAGAGSGGVIVFDGGVEHVLNSTKKSQDAYQLDLDASGGYSDYNSGKADYNGCANGASGTIYFRGSDTLILDNKEKVTDKYTRMQAPKTNQKWNSPHLIAKSVVLQGRANGAILGEHHWMAFDDLRLDANVTLTLDRERY